MRTRTTVLLRHGGNRHRFQWQRNLSFEALESRTLLAPLVRADAETEVMGVPAVAPSIVRHAASILAGESEQDGPLAMDTLASDATDAIGATSTTTVTLTTNPYRNGQNPPDVDGDGRVLPIDALWVINDLNARGARELSPLVDAPKQIDVSGDMHVTPTDALWVINAMGPTARVAGESAGEPLLRVRLEPSQTVGGPALSGPVNGTDDPAFFVNVYVKDLRELPAGVVGGALDLNWTTDLVTASPILEFGSSFGLFQQGQVYNENKLVDEAGALTASPGVGATVETLLLALAATANADGSVDFAASPGNGTATITPANFALVGRAEEVDWQDVEFIGATVEIVFEPDGTVTISGSVYADTDGDNHFDPLETGLAGVTVTLIGMDNGVERTTVTDSQGAYRFERLPPGTYEVLESHPRAFLDGPDRIGTAGGTTDNDRFSEITLQSNEGSSENNFGEAGLRPEYISRQMFLASSPPFAEYLADVIRRTSDPMPATNRTQAVDAVFAQVGDWLADSA